MERQKRWRNITLASTLALSSLLSADSKVSAFDPRFIPGLESLINSKQNFLFTDSLQLSQEGEVFGIVSQPENNPGWVAFGNNLTEFALAREWNESVTWLLVHNVSETAKEIFDLEPGNFIFLVRDENISVFKVNEASQYQAFPPDSPQATFTNLDDLTDELSASELFRRVITTEHGEEILVLQTCIEKDGVWTWGRYFVEATKIGEVKTGK